MVYSLRKVGVNKNGRFFDGRVIIELKYIILIKFGCRVIWWYGDLNLRVNFICYFLFGDM